MATACMLGHPAAGHVNPTLPVIAELARRGDRITYFATPPLQARIETAGAAFASYGPHEQFERGLAQGGMLGGMAALAETAEALLPDVLARVRALEPEYLLLEAHSLIGHLVAQTLPIPAVTLCSMFALNERLIAARDLMAHLYSRAPREQVVDGLAALARYAAIGRRLTRAHGVFVPGIVDYLGNRQRLNVVLTSREFQVGPAAFDDSYCFVGASAPSPSPLDEDLSRRLDDRPLVYVSMGTMYNDEAGLYAACFDAFGGRDVQVVLSIGQRVDEASLPPAPDNVIVRRHVPQFALLARASLFITHGGINSAHEAMLHGVPLVVLPLAADHHIVAQQVEAVGAGVVLDRAAVTVERLRQLAGHVLDEPSYRERSRAVGHSLAAAGGAARAADAIGRHVMTSTSQKG